MGVEKLAQAYGADYEHAGSLQELLQTLIRLEAEPNPITVIEVDTTRATRRALAQRLAR